MFDLTECPQKFVEEVVDVIPLADLFHNGLAPMAGGVLDQSAWFIDAARTIKREDRRVLDYLTNQ